MEHGMSNLSNDQVQSLNKTVKAFIQVIHTAIERKDVQRMSELVLDDVFVFGAAANAVSIGKNRHGSGMRKSTFTI
jgi:ketosteroid isomerase-like protein